MMSQHIPYSIFHIPLWVVRSDRVIGMIYSILIHIDSILIPYWFHIDSMIIFISRSFGSISHSRSFTSWLQHIFRWVIVPETYQCLAVWRGHQKKLCHLTCSYIIIIYTVLYNIIYISLTSTCFILKSPSFRLLTSPWFWCSNSQFLIVRFCMVSFIEHGWKIPHL